LLPPELALLTGDDMAMGRSVLSCKLFPPARVTRRVNTVTGGDLTLGCVYLR
jgi:hypothetical protein